MLVLISYLRITIIQAIELLEDGHVDMAIKFLRIAKDAIEKDMNEAVKQ